MKVEEVKKKPLNILLGFIADLYADISCECLCKEEVYACDDEWVKIGYKRVVEEKITKCKTEGNYENCPQRIAFERIKEATDKQTQKKPIHETVTNDVQGFPYEDVYVRCPSCGNRFYSIIDGEIVAGKKTNYCSECGQRIDWSE